MAEAFFWLAENGSEANGTVLDSTLFHFAEAPIQAFPGQVFKGNTGCSPHSPSDYMTIENMVRMHNCNYSHLHQISTLTLLPSLIFLWRCLLAERHAWRCHGDLMACTKNIAGVE
jgi:hypothetical protein